MKNPNYRLMHCMPRSPVLDPCSHSTIAEVHFTIASAGLQWGLPLPQSTLWVEIRPLRAHDAHNDSFLLRFGSDHDMNLFRNIYFKIE